MSYRAALAALRNTARNEEEQWDPDFERGRETRGGWEWESEEEEVRTPDEEGGEERKKQREGSALWRWEGEGVQEWLEGCE